MHLMVVTNPGGSAENNLLRRRRCRRPGFDPWVRKIPWRRAGKPTPGFLPGEPHGQRSLGGYSPQGHKESDTTERPILLQTKKETWDMTSTLCCSYSRRLYNSLAHRVRTYFNYLLTFRTDWLASKLLEGRDCALIIFVFFFFFLYF